MIKQKILFVIFLSIYSGFSFGADRNLDAAREQIEKYQLEEFGAEGIWLKVLERTGVREPVDTIKHPSYAKGEERERCGRIRFLVNQNYKSAWHVQKFDETWEYESGDVLKLHIIKEGLHSIILLGDPAVNSQHVKSYKVQAGANYQEVYMGAELIDNPSHNYFLGFATTEPAFEMCDANFDVTQELLAKYPNLEKVIMRLAK